RYRGFTRLFKSVLALRLTPIDAALYNDEPSWLRFVRRMERYRQVSVLYDVLGQKSARSTCDGWVQLRV
ncbi:MAG: hypothetical protein AAGC95_18510, partial [Pseudomonadota bacterium]